MITINQTTFKITDYRELQYISTNRIIVLLKEKFMVIDGIQLEISYFSGIEIHGKGNLESITFRDTI